MTSIAQPTSIKDRQFHPIPFPVAVGIILVVWLAYTGLVALDNTERLEQPVVAILEPILALLGLSVLLLAGFSASDCFLRLDRLSKKGLLAFLITSPLFLPVFLTGTWTGWNTINVLVYAPATAISQELFFRCTILPVFSQLIRGRPYLAIFLAALLHGLWHVGPLFMGQAWYVVLPVMAVPFLGGLAWNWQARHDRTVVWVTIYHILIDQGVSLFTWGS